MIFSLSISFFFSVHKHFQAILKFAFISWSSQVTEHRQTLLAQQEQMQTEMETLEAELQQFEDENAKLKYQLEIADKEKVCKRPT